MFTPSASRISLCCAFGQRSSAACEKSHSDSRSCQNEGDGGAACKVRNLFSGLRNLQPGRVGGRAQSSVLVRPADFGCLASRVAPPAGARWEWLKSWPSSCKDEPLAHAVRFFSKKQMCSLPNRSRFNVSSLRVSWARVRGQRNPPPFDLLPYEWFAGPHPDCPGKTAGTAFSRPLCKRQEKCSDRLRR